ncbi:MAG TPA: hemolysin family protein [Vicinamibacterales bacterium]|nr:hemolysin family protein [Vicinamibacterales bacterium]
MIPFLVFLAASGLLFFAVVETAFALLMRLPQRLEAERESEGDPLAAYLDDPLKFFVPARLMRGLLLVLAIALLSEPLGSSWGGVLTLFLAGAAISVGVGQVLPAIIVRNMGSPERVLELFLPMFTAVANALSPVTILIIGWIGGGAPPSRAQASADASGTPRLTPTAPTRAEETRLLRSVVDFGETLVREVMTPRPDIVAIRSTATIDDLRKLVQEQEYSRLPVFTDNLDNIAGLVVVKDLIQMTDPALGAKRVTEIMRPAAFVPETKRVADLLREFQQGRFQLAIVVDEYGGTAGLVTVEDVVEELVGEIRDEYDLEAEPIVREADDTFVFSGKVAIGDLVDRLSLEGLEIEDAGFETVGGYVLTRVGRVPAVGEKFSFDGLEVEILEAERRRIHKVRIRRQPPPAPEGEAEASG